MNSLAAGSGAVHRPGPISWETPLSPEDSIRVSTTISALAVAGALACSAAPAVLAPR